MKFDGGRGPGRESAASGGHCVWHGQEAPRSFLAVESSGAGGLQASAVNDFWESPENVARFAAREPDVRLMGLVPGFPDPDVVRVLDLGCAGGRNPDFLARRGVDVCAVDASKAVVAGTPPPLASPLGGDH